MRVGLMTATLVLPLARLSGNIVSPLPSLPPPAQETPVDEELAAINAEEDTAPQGNTNATHPISSASSSSRSALRTISAALNKA